MFIGEEVLLDGVEVGQCVQEEHFEGEPIVAMLIVISVGGLVNGETVQLGVVHPVCNHWIIGLLKKRNKMQPRVEIKGKTCVIGDTGVWGVRGMENLGYM